MARSGTAILFLAGITFAGSGFGMWRSKDTINGFVNGLMHMTNPNAPTFDVMGDMSIIYGLIGFGSFLIICGVLVAIFGGRRR